MSTTAPNLAPVESRPFSIRLPRPLWIGVATAVVIVVSLGLRVGLPIYRQHAAVAEIERLGGMVFTEPCGPEWLEPLLYNIDQDLGDQLVTVTSVCLEGRPVRDDTLDHLVWLSDVKELRLNLTEMTDARLARLKELRNLKRVDLVQCPVTDAGVADLQKALPGLTVNR
jgi:hypothetical protein